jgi:hypothetical protein
LLKIDGLGDIDDVTNRITEALADRGISLPDAALS